jgi:Lrp/AsnC family leucine-responsive transcriptional regulator
MLRSASSPRAYLVSGDSDYQLKVAAKSTGDFERLYREKISKLPGVRQTKSSFVLRMAKDSPVPV